MFKLVVFIPETHLDVVKNAMFSAGAGRIGQYAQCSWQVLGQGQFRPMAGSSPFLGETDQLEVVSEYRVEMVCADDYVDATIIAMKEAHPYEEPAYDVIRLETL